MEREWRVAGRLIVLKKARATALNAKEQQSHLKAKHNFRFPFKTQNL